MKLRVNAPANIALLEERARVFQSLLGRPLRVAHVGNIANNAYLAAKVERSIGIDSVVISPDYSHVMGFPSWDESLCVARSGSHFSGDLRENDQPEWFVYGTWQQISEKIGVKSRPTPGIDSNSGRLTFDRARSRVSKLIQTGYVTFREPLLRRVPRNAQDFIANDVLFVTRRSLARKWIVAALENFDIVNAYGPYNAFLPSPSGNLISTEHGTLRDFTRAWHVMSKSSRRAYSLSKAILVTNQDNLATANSLVRDGTARVYAMPHPSNIAGPIDQALPQEICQHLTSMDPRLLVLAPARHSSASNVDRGKGLNHLYEAIEKSIAQGLGVRFLLIEWGDQARQVRMRLSDLESEGYVTWLPLVSRPGLTQIMKSVQCVIDQFLIPAYGGVGLDALRNGTVLLSRSDPNLDRQFFGEAAPVIDIRSSRDVIDALRTLTTDRDYAAELAMHGQSWFECFASWHVSLNTRIKAYEYSMGLQ